MRQIEVEKIYKSIGFDCDKKRVGYKICFSDSQKIGQFIDKNVAKTLIKPAKIVRKPEDTFVADVSGIHYHRIGQKNLQIPNVVVDQSLSVVSISVRSKNVVLDNMDNYSYDYCYLSNFICDKNRDFSKPISGYFMLEGQKETSACTIRFKNNNCVVAIFDKPYDGILPDGKSGVLYDRKGIGGKIIGSGELRGCGLFTEMDRVFEKKADLDDEKVVVVADKFLF